MTATEYSEAFFDHLEFGSARSAKLVVPIMFSALHPRSVLDVGCGRGTWLREWKKAGAIEVHGIDGKYLHLHNLAIREHQFTSVDVSRPVSLNRKFDLVTSLEVAEHLPNKSSDVFVQNLVNHGSKIMFSAASVGQGGTNHTNERPLEFWRAEFLKHDFAVFDFLRPRICRDTRIEPWYRYNTLLYVHESVIDDLPEPVKAAHLPASTAVANLEPLMWRVRKMLLRPLPVSLVTRLARFKARTITKAG